MNNSKHLKKVLFHSIDTLCKEHHEFFNNPDTDFSRNKKLSLDQLIKLILSMEAGSIKDELYQYFDYDFNTPTSSAFVQARNKLSYKGFEWLFKEFDCQTYSKKNNLYKGYRLLAVDGSDVLIRTDINDKETYQKQISRNKDIPNGFNAFHIVTSYDLLEHTYDNLIIQPTAHKNECYALNQLTDAYTGDKAIFIADRGFAAYNCFEHIVHSGNKYLIRAKDISKKTKRNMLTTMIPDFPGDEFDICCAKILTYRATNFIKNNPQVYRWLPINCNFDYLDEEHTHYLFKCRILRFKLDNGSYETIITNLEKDTFSISDIKNLYNLRWGIETSFRELKYAVDLCAFHCKKHNSIKQEIYARIIFYNFSERIMRNVKPKKGKIKRKHLYQINFTRAFHTIRYFLRYKKGGKKPPDVESIISDNIEPVRLNRSDPRKIRKQKAIYFIYRLN